MPSDVIIKPHDGFYFFYKLLGNDVSSEPFQDVINPSFAAERASVRILSNMTTLKMFFQRNPSLKVKTYPTPFFLHLSHLFIQEGKKNKCDLSCCYEK